MANFVVKVEDFAQLARLDGLIAALVAAERCPFCSGPLHVANYHRKPRGGAVGSAGEAFTLRHSLCCGKRGCRKRVLPPSLRFLGRRVYLEMVVLFAALHAQVEAAWRRASAATQVPERTLQRWLAWWQQALPRRPWWLELRARFAQPPDDAQLPRSFVEQLQASCAGARDVAWLAARCLAPGTTRQRDAARFVRDACGVEPLR